MRLVKYLFIVLFVLISIVQSHAQINVGPIAQVNKKGNQDFNAKNLIKLKNSTTYFVYRDSDKDSLEKWKKVLDSTWTLTKLKYISFTKFLFLRPSDTTSFLSIEGYHVVQKTENGTLSENSHFYLTLNMGRTLLGRSKLQFCRIELYPTAETYKKASELITGFGSSKMLAYLYSDATLHNWNLGFLKNSLQMVQSQLLKTETVWIFGDAHSPNLKEVPKDTLYIPDYTLIKFNKWNMDESKRHKIEDLMKKYPFPYKLVSVQELNSLILDPEREIHYLSYIKSSTDKYVSVINSRTGEFVYREYTPITYNIKPKDLAKLASKIKQLDK